MLTDKEVRDLKPKAKPYREFDMRGDGLYVQVSTGGTKTFYLKYRFNGKYRFLNLGRYPAVALRTARADAASARAKVLKGIDPKIHREETRQQYVEKIAQSKKREIEARNTGTVEQLFDVYIARPKKNGKPKSAAHIGEIRRVYNKDVRPVLGGSAKARDVTSSEIKAVLARVAKRGAAIQANRTHAYLHGAFAAGIWHDKNAADELRFRLQLNPVYGIERPIQSEPAGDRNLSNDEIRTFWHALDESGCTIYTNTGLKLLLATGGQRVGEVVGMRWSEINFNDGLWELPSERSKNGRPHAVPLETIAIELLNRLPQTSEHVFPSNRGGHMTDQALVRAVNRLRDKMDMPPFVPRDIRRTCKSRMGELQISKDIRGRLHNHALGDVSSKHYDRYEYLPEKRAAMRVWNEHLKRILSPEKAPVVHIKQAHGRS